MTTKPSTDLSLWQVIKPVQSTINWAISLSVISVIASLVPLTLIAQVATALELKNYLTVWQLVLIAFVATAISLFCRTWSFRVSHIGAFKLEEILRNRLADHLAKLPLGYVISTGSGAIKKIIQDDVKALHAFVADSTPLMARAYATPALAFLILLFTDWHLTLATIALVPFAILLTQLAMKDYAERRRDYDQANEEINNTVIEFVQGMQVVRTFDDGTTSFVRFRDSLDQFTTKLKDWSESTATSGRIGYLSFQALPTLLIIAAIGSWLLIQGIITFPILLLFLLLAPSIIGSFMPLMMLSHHINRAATATIRIGQVFAEPELPQTLQPRVPHDASIQFDHVSFSYNDRPALENISFNLSAGSTTALVGPSGAGKTTIARLIPRFWDVTTGAIQIGGVDVREMSSETLMSWVSFVFQDAFLLHDTIRENIRLGKPNATDAEIEAAAIAAQTHDFILTLSDGYDTIAGERGTKLSGGQRQRITIARAILQNNPIIVLDEATAFTDPENEALIQAAIASLTKNKTLITVAHRLQTITNADQILVIDRGHIVERGTHPQLLEAPNLYAKLWENYQQAQNWTLQVRQREKIS